MLRNWGFTSVGLAAYRQHINFSEKLLKSYSVFSGALLQESSGKRALLKFEENVNNGDWM